jgi:hypothetical protein
MSSQLKPVGSAPKRRNRYEAYKDRRRKARPERITIGGVEFVRNDVLAREQGTTERTINRADARAAPYTYIGGCKYRPREQYHEFLLTQIKVRNQKPPEKPRGRTQKL